MNSSVLRNILLTIAVTVFVGQLVYLFLPYLYLKPIQLISEEVSAFSSFMRNLTYFLIALPISAVCLWAAQNLKKINILSDEILEKILKTVFVLVFVSVAIELVRTVKDLAPYFPEIVSPSIHVILETINWYTYSIGELVILVFAIRQTRLKIENSSLAKA